MKIECIPSGVLRANSYLAFDEETKKGFIVDPGGFEQKMIDEIEKNGCSIEYIILTHGHGDHIGGVPEYKEKLPGVKLLAAETEVPLLADVVLNESRMCAGRELVLKPDVTVTDGETLEIGGMTLKFIMTPGHTPGGMCILAGDVLFSGDTLFCRSIGRTDFPGGSFREIMESIREKLLVLPEETRVLPGHMGPTTVGEEKRENPFV
ncbi:MAG: MBL fold metallo-hydrolase [Clostridia bacterium]|nr:MBL fold metallo-hydrolase [Clostridia bacterium]